MSTLQLKPKQVEALQQVLVQKQQLNAALKELQQKESLLLELIFEAADVAGEISGVKLEGDKLTYEVAAKKEKAPKAKKEEKTDK